MTFSVKLTGIGFETVESTSAWKKFTFLTSALNS